MCAKQKEQIKLHSLSYDLIDINSLPWELYPLTAVNREYVPFHQDELRPDLTILEYSIL